MKFLREKIKYFDLVIAVVLSYIFIKLIGNYNYFLLGLGKLLGILTPFIIAFIIAYILNPIMKLFEKKFKLKRSLSILLTYLLIIGIIVIVFIYIVPKVSNSIIDIAGNIPDLAHTTQKWFDDFVKNGKVAKIISSTDMFNFKPDFILSKLSGILMSLVNNLFSQTISFANSLIKFGFGFLISIYVLYDKEKFVDFGKRLIYIVFKRKYGEMLITLFKNINYMIGLYIGTKALDSLIVGIIALVGLLILGSQYALLVAVVVGITNMIPYFGPAIGMIVAVMVNVFTNPLKALFILILLFLLQQFDAWYLEPKLISGKVGLSAFLVILAVTLGGALYGPIGMLLGSPIMAVIKIYIDKLIARYNNRTNKVDMVKK